MAHAYTTSIVAVGAVRLKIQLAHRHRHRDAAASGRKGTGYLPADQFGGGAEHEVGGIAVQVAGQPRFHGAWPRPRAGTAASSSSVAAPSPNAVPKPVVTAERNSAAIP
jgi:hypothetical protein